MGDPSSALPRLRGISPRLEVEDFDRGDTNTKPKKKLRSSKSIEIKDCNPQKRLFKQPVVASTAGSKRPNQAAETPTKNLKASNSNS